MKKTTAFALLALLGAMAMNVQAAIGVPTGIGHSNIDQSYGTSLTVSVTSSVAVNNTVIVAAVLYAYSGPYAGTATVSDSAGNTYTDDADVSQSGSTGERTVVFSAPVTSALSPGDTITITFSGGGYYANASAFAVSGLVAASRVDQSATATGTSGSPSSGNTANTTQADELLIGAIGVNDGASTASFTAGAGYTALPGDVSSAGLAIFPEYQVVSATGAYSAGGTLGGVYTGWAAAIVTYKALPSSPITTASTATATAAGQTRIAVSMPYTGDDNANNTYTVEYKFSSGSSWTTWVTNAAHSVSPYTTTITGLTPGGSYDVRATYNDPDGVTGANPQTITSVTTAGPGVSILSDWSNLYHGTSTSTQNITYNVPTGSGANRVLVVAIATSRSSAGSRTVALTYGGQALTLVNGDLGSSTDQHTALYYLDEAGLEAAASSTLSVAVSGGTTWITDVSAAVFDGVDQSNPITDSQTYSSGTSTPTSFSFATALTVNGGCQAVEVINCTRTGNSRLRTITYAANWSKSEGQSATSGGNYAITNSTADRSIPVSNTTDASSTSFNHRALASMTALSLTPAKATPAVIWPAASAITPGQALSASTLSGGESPVSGAFAFATPSTIPLHGNYSASVTFIPADTTHYNTAAGNVNVVVNTPPWPGMQYLTTTLDTTLHVSASVLASLNYDADGDTLTITAVSSASTNDGAVTLSGGNVNYTPAAGYVGADQFTYIVSDGYAGGTAICTNKVKVTLGKATSAFNYISGTRGTVNLRGYGIPGHQYDIQYSGDPSFATNAVLATVTAAAGNGLILYTDATAGTGPRYYRFAVH